MSEFRQIGAALAAVDCLAGAVQDVSPGAFTDPLRAEARLLLLDGLAGVRAEVAGAADCVLDGSPVRPGVFREIVECMRVLRPLVPLLVARQVQFVMPGCVRDAQAIEADIGWLRRRVRRSRDSYFRAEACRWLHDAVKCAARLRAGRCGDDAWRAARRLREQAEELAEDFSEEL